MGTLRRGFWRDLKFNIGGAKSEYSPISPQLHLLRMACGTIIFEEF